MSRLIEIFGKLVLFGVIFYSLATSAIRFLDGNADAAAGWLGLACGLIAMLIAGELADRRKP